MSQSQGDFTPPVKAGYKADGPFHRRNWRALTDFLRTNFVSTSHLQDGSVSGIKLQDLAVTDAKIESLSVDKLTTGTLSADVVLGSTIKTADTGQRVEIDSNGLRLTDGSADTVNIPVSGESSFSGGVQASSLRSDEATLAGDTTVDSHGHMRFSAGVADPSVAPSIAWTWDETPLISGADAFRGIEWDGTNNYLIACTPASNIFRGWPTAGGAAAWSRSTVLFPGTPSGKDLKPYGVTRMGTDLYVATINPDNGHPNLLKYSTTAGVPTTLVLDVVSTGSPEFTNLDHLAGVTNDGTYIYVGFVKANDDVCLSKWDSSLVYQSTITLEAGFESGDRTVYDVEHQVIDGGKWWVVWGNSVTNSYNVRAYDSAPSHLAAEDFALPADSRGVAFDGTVFVTTPSAPSFFRKHTTWRSSAAYEHVKYAWNDNGAGYESLASVQARIAYNQRAKLRVTWPAFPSAGVDRARVYFLEDNSTASPAAGAMKRQGGEVGTSQTYATYNSGGAADATSNTFPEATPARLTLPVRSSAPGSPEPGEIYFDSGSTKARVWDGAAWNALW